MLRKRDLLRKNLLQSALAERDALARSGANPFVIRFFYSFTSKQNLYLVMEYAPGGDLYSLLQALKPACTCPNQPQPARTRPDSAPNIRI